MILEYLRHKWLLHRHKVIKCVCVNDVCVYLGTSSRQSTVCNGKIYASIRKVKDEELIRYYLKDEFRTLVVQRIKK